MIAPWLNAFALSGRVNIICCGTTQGAATLALGYVPHWAFSPPLPDNHITTGHTPSLFLLPVLGAHESVALLLSPTHTPRAAGLHRALNQ